VSQGRRKTFPPHPSNITNNSEQGNYLPKTWTAMTSQKATKQIAACVPKVAFAPTFCTHCNSVVRINEPGREIQK